MALLRVTMIAKKVSECPTFSKGDQVTIDYPQIVLEETDKVCLLALDQCHPYILPLSKGVAYATLGVGEEIGTLRCSCFMGTVTFNGSLLNLRVPILGAKTLF